MQTPVLTVLEEDKHAWFAGRTRAILKYLDLEMVPRKPGVKRTVLDVGGWFTLRRNCNAESELA